jgi:peptidyl-prolyl cis-trans isomerase D
MTTSGLVKTNYGYHIIRVASHREESVRPLIQAKEAIRQRLTADRVRALAESQSEAVAAALRNGRTLEEAAREQGLAVAKSVPAARGEVASPLGSPAIVARAFEMKKGDIEKEAFPVPQGFAFVSLNEIQPPRVPELKEVQDKVKADLSLERAREKARSQAAEIRAKAEGVGLEKAASASGLVRKETPALVGRGQPIGDLGTNAGLDEAAFALPAKTLSEPLSVPAGYAVIRVLEKQAFDPAAFAQQKDAITAALRAEKQGQLFQAFIDEARKKVVVERRPDAFRRLVS